MRAPIDTTDWEQEKKQKYNLQRVEMKIVMIIVMDI